MSLMALNGTTNLYEVFGKEFTKQDAEWIANAYHDGDELVAGVIAKGINVLAPVLASIMVATGITRVVIVGGFASALGERYRESLSSLIVSRCEDLDRARDVTVVLGDTRGHAALIGAGRGWRTMWLSAQGVDVPRSP